jgi:hypothetical protein
VVILLALMVGLLITGAAICPACEHPTLAQPLDVGAAAKSALTALAGFVARSLRRPFPTAWQLPAGHAPYGAVASAAAPGCRRITYAAPAPAPNSAANDTPVASHVAPSHWAP